MEKMIPEFLVWRAGSEPRVVMSEAEADSLAKTHAQDLGGTFKVYRLIDAYRCTSEVVRVEVSDV